jgi:restriction endonuclease S subunit
MKKKSISDCYHSLMLSEGFSQHSIKNSKGSVNPYVNWKDLAGYELLLPPLRKQAELSELLWMLDNSRQTDLTHVSKLKRAYKTLLNQMMIHGTESLDGKVIKTKCGLVDERLNVIQLKDCLLEKPSYGANASSKSYEEGSPRYIRITDIDDDGKLIDDELVTIDTENYSDYILEDNDFLFARTGNTVGKTHLYRSITGQAVYAGYLIRFRLNEQMLRPKFLFYFTKSLKFESFKRKMVKVGAQPNINSEEYQSMHLPKLPVRVQDGLIEKLDSYCEMIELAEQKSKHAKSLQTSLINKVF